MQPITRSLIRIELSLQPDFRWNEKVHGAAQTFHVLVEDVDGEIVLFADTFVLRARYAEDEHTMTITVPMFEPVPPNYYVSVISNNWLNCEFRLPISFQGLILPEKFPPPTALLEGDIVLTLNGRVVTRVSELDVMYSHEALDAVVVRDGEEVRLEVATAAADHVETDHAVSFCGAVLQAPHQAVRQQISELHSGVYVSARTRGSPAYQYGLAPTNFITNVNGKPTPDLKAFLEAVVAIPDNTCKTAS